MDRQGASGPYCIRTNTLSRQFPANPDRNSNESVRPSTVASLGQTIHHDGGMDPPSKGGLKEEGNALRQFLSPGLSLPVVQGFNRDDFELSSSTIASTSTTPLHKKSSSFPGFSSSSSLFPAENSTTANNYSAPYTTRHFSFDRPYAASGSSGRSSRASSPENSTTEEMEKRVTERRKAWLVESEGDGEESGLAAARRALWEDPPTICCQNVAAVISAGKEGEEGEEDEESEEEEEEDTPVELEPLPSPFRPCHTTLTPLPSCLRPPLGPSSSSRPSASSITANSIASSSSCSSPSTFSSSLPSTQSPLSSPTLSSSNLHCSVQFSDATPIPATTYSPIDYERKGNGPVEKLSLREWVELRDVRGAVGVWSGKVSKWQEGDETPLSSSIIYSSSTTTTAATATAAMLMMASGLIHHVGTPSVENAVISGGGGYFGELVEGVGRIRIEEKEKDSERCKGEAEGCCAIAGVVTLHH